MDSNKSTGDDTSAENDDASNEITQAADDKEAKGKDDSSEETKSTRSSLSFNSGDDIYYFTTGSSSISKGDKKLIQLAKELNSSKLKITLIGHTDNTGSTAANLILAKVRAKKVSSFLISQGVSRSQITINSEGESSPLYPNNNAENRRKNRRVEIVY